MLILVTARFFLVSSVLAVYPTPTQCFFCFLTLCSVFFPLSRQSNACWKIVLACRKIVRFGREKNIYTRACARGVFLCVRVYVEIYVFVCVCVSVGI